MPSMKTINAVLKKPAREQDAFRAKLEEALDEVDRVRRDAAAFKLSALEVGGASIRGLRCTTCGAAARLTAAISCRSRSSSTSSTDSSPP